MIRNAENSKPGVVRAALDKSEAKLQLGEANVAVASKTPRRTSPSISDSSTSIERQRNPLRRRSRVLTHSFCSR